MLLGETDRLTYFHGLKNFLNRYFGGVNVNYIRLTAEKLNAFFSCVLLYVFIFLLIVAI